MYLLLLCAVLSTVLSEDTEVLEHYTLAQYLPVDESLHAVTSSEPRTWLEMRAQCNAEHLGHLLWMGSETPPEVTALCPRGGWVPSGAYHSDTGLTWNNFGDLSYLYKLISPEQTKSLEIYSALYEGPYGAFVWPSTRIRFVGNETKFTCAICEMSRRLNVVTQGVSPPHNNSIYAYDLELVSNSRIKDLGLVANGSDLTDRLLGDLAEAFNISIKSLRWHGATFNEDQKAVVHVYYDPPEGDNMEWDDYVRWYDQYFDHKTVANFEVKMIKLNTECLVAKKFLSNAKRETFLTGFVDARVVNDQVVVRECYWDEANENAVWSRHTKWEADWQLTYGADVQAAETIFHINREGPEFKNELKLADIAMYYGLNRQLSGMSSFYSLNDLTNVTNTLLTLHSQARPLANVANILSFTIPVQTAKVLMAMPLFEKQPVELSRTLLANVLVADLDASDPVVGLALSLTAAGTSAQISLAQLNHGNLSRPPDTSTIVVAVSDAIAFSANRLAIATYAAHLDLANQTTRYDDSIDGWMAFVQVTFKRSEYYGGDLENDYVDIAFKPAFPVPTLRGRCAERIFATEEWKGENCRVLKSVRDGMTVCRCKNLYKVNDITTNVFIIFGFDASLRTFFANNLSLVIVIVIVCFMSALGLLGVVLTAVVFPEWRADQGHRIFLQMVLALSVNLVLGFVSNLTSIDTKSVACMTIGVLRHYSFLAMFFWMMVLSGLQVKRLTTIAGAKTTTHLKVSLIAWGLPLIPIVILLAWDTGFYKSEVSHRGYCYPEDVAFQATVQGPAGVILIANLVIFVIILNHIYGWVNCNKDVVVRKHTINDRAAQLRNLGNSIFVFCLFGLTWTFHFLSEEGIINSEFLFEFLYLITASFHLFMLSLIFIVLDKKTRGLWGKVLTCMSQPVAKVNNNVSINTNFKANSTVRNRSN